MSERVDLALRVGIFIAVFVPLLAAERRWPLRIALAARCKRMRDNLGLFFSGVACVRLLPLSGVGFAFLAQQQSLGLFNHLHLRLSIAFIATLALLDAAVYFQHRLMHRWPALWRLHRVHHSDRFLDASSALRFHPAEIVLSALYKGALIVLLGAPPVAVLCFEALLNASAMFNHSNLALAPRVDRMLRAVLVTPAMHWIHHSIRPHESRRNFGFCLSWWDRLFGSYQEAPQDGYDAMHVGVEHLEEDAPGVLSLLAQPTRDVPAPEAGSYVPGGTA